MNVIEVNNLCHKYNGWSIYEDLSFSVPEGSICGLLGKNGQGKTTLVNILMGFLKPTGGKCLVLGEDSHELPSAVRNRIGLLHEGHLAYEFITIGQTERFFLDVLQDFAGLGGKTIFVTSHIVQDLEQLVDTMIFIDQGEIWQTGLSDFMSSFHKFSFRNRDVVNFGNDTVLSGWKQRGDQITVYSFASQTEVADHLGSLGVKFKDLQQKTMSLEDGFIGLMGKY